uniref:Uncharacterized protein n=1 Tax=Romanomermis culicivorax TaxID=13658 RepID=A0A915ID18_ROMCU
MKAKITNLVKFEEEFHGVRDYMMDHQIIRRSQYHNMTIRQLLGTLLLPKSRSRLYDNYEIITREDHRMIIESQNDQRTTL